MDNIFSKTISISYLISTKNEGKGYIKPLFDRLLKFKRKEDEIIVVDDFSTDETTLEILEEYKEKINVHQRKFEGDFADHKNYMNSLCTKDFICNIDADELPNESFLATLPEILLNNPDIELFFVPRINIVNGITNEYIEQTGWSISQEGYINYPDYQGRVYKNNILINWVGDVHEKIFGHKTYASLPAFDSRENIVQDYCLLHIKNFQRQLKQNELYAEIFEKNKVDKSWKSKKNVVPLQK